MADMMQSLKIPATENSIPLIEKLRSSASRTGEQGKPLTERISTN
jgi:hypothetical protein